MPKLNSREKALLCVLALASIPLWLMLPDDGRGSGLGSMGSDDHEGGPGEPPSIPLALLSREAERYDPSGRNLFEYREPAVAHAPTPTTTPPPPPDITPSPPKQPATIPVVRPPVQAVSPRPRFDFVGYLGPRKNLIAVFSRNKEVFVARIGEKVDDEFELVGLRYQTAILRSIGDKHGGRTVKLPQRSG
jgi:hypothetical protein